MFHVELHEVAGTIGRLNLHSGRDAPRSRLTRHDAAGFIQGPPKSLLNIRLLWDQRVRESDESGAGTPSMGCVCQCHRRR